MINVYINNELRKVEMFTQEDVQEAASKLPSTFSVDTNAIGAYTQGDNVIGFYYGSLPNVDIDLSGIELDPQCGNLISIRYDISNNSTRIKVYGRTSKNEACQGLNIPLEYQNKQYVGHGSMHGENLITIYFEDETVDKVCTKWTGITFDTTTGEQAFTESKYETG